MLPVRGRVARCGVKPNRAITSPSPARRAPFISSKIILLFAHIMYAEEQIYDEDPTDTEEYHIYFPGASEAELTDADARITALQQKLPGFLQPQKEKVHYVHVITLTNE